MSEQLVHADIEELLGAFALDALDPDEAQAVEDHLRTCPRCRQEVADHRATAALLAHSGRDAPAGVWDRIAGSLTDAPPAGDRPVLLSAAAERRRPAFRIAVGAMAVAAAVVAILGVTVLRQNHRLDRLSQSQAVTAALVDPGAHKVQLLSADRAVSVDAVVLPDGRGYVVRSSLPELGAGHTYQLWALRDGVATSLGVLGRDPGVVAFKADGIPPALAVTAEKAPHGAPQPTGAPVVTGEVRSA